MGKKINDCTDCPFGSPVMGICTCPAGHVIHDHQCLVSCPYLTSIDVNTNICVTDCLDMTNCLTCSNSITCSDCLGYGYLYKGQCVSACPSGS